MTYQDALAEVHLPDCPPTSLHNGSARPAIERGYLLFHGQSREDRAIVKRLLQDDKARMQSQRQHDSPLMYPWRRYRSN